MRKDIYIAALAVIAIALHLIFRFALTSLSGWQAAPLLIALVIGGSLIVKDLIIKLRKGDFGSDFLAGVSIVTALLLDEYLAGVLVVLMLSGGETLESYAVARASSVLGALARRMPQIAHRREDTGLREVAVSEINPGDVLEIFPHEICPVDGLVLEGRGVMDESFLTGEPYQISKTPGAAVISGALNGDSAITIRALKPAADSRYARIMQVIAHCESRRPRIRRLGDQLGGVYAPIALLVAISAWVISGESVRFLAVLVVATPCPLLIAIPVAIIGSISLAAKHGIIIRDPAVLEKLSTCRTIVFDKTGTLTYGKPELTEIMCAVGTEEREVVRLVATLEQYSKHPLAAAVLERARKMEIDWPIADSISEKPGQGLVGKVEGREVLLTGRAKLEKSGHPAAAQLPPLSAGLECVVLIDGRYAATFRFHDAPRRDSRSFVGHLSRLHRFESVIMLSGDRESEVRYLAKELGIEQLYFNKSPEEKLAIVAEETKRRNTVYIGDGVNDAPALMTATVGIALGQAHEVTAESAGAVVMDPSLRRVDELFHIGARMRGVALQSAVGGMLISILGMGFAAVGMLPPVAGAVVQEVIDLAAVLNALRAAYPPRRLTDY